MAMLPAMALSLLAFAPPAESTFSGGNGPIAYTSGNGEEEPYVIRTIRPDGTRPQVLLRPRKAYAGGPYGPQWSRDGRRVLFAGDRGYDNEHLLSESLWYATASGARIKRIPLGLGRRGLQGGWAWSPGGRRVVFAAGRFPSVSSKIYSIRLDGTGRRRLTRHPNRNDYRPSWSDDGRHIVFERTHSSGLDHTRRIFVMRSNGSGLRRLTGSDQDSHPSFSPDGRRVAFVRSFAGREEWRTVGISGGAEAQVRPHDPRSNFRYGPPQWSPDGTRLASIRGEDPPGTDVPGPVSFVSFPPAGGPERVEFGFPDSPWPLPAPSWSWRPATR